MAAEFEEMVDSTAVIKPEHFGEQVRRRVSSVCVRGAMYSPSRVGRGQRLIVQFAVAIEWDAGDGDKGGGHHVIRQSLRKKGTQLGGVGNGVAVMRNNVGDQARGCARLLGARDHDRLGDAG